MQSKLSDKLQGYITRSLNGDIRSARQLYILLSVPEMLFDNRTELLEQFAQENVSNPYSMLLRAVLLLADTPDRNAEQAREGRELMAHAAQQGNTIAMVQQGVMSIMDDPSDQVRYEGWMLLKKATEKREPTALDTLKLMFPDNPPANFAEAETIINETLEQIPGPKRSAP